jgi:hypothetical protein
MHKLKPDSVKWGYSRKQLNTDGFESDRRIPRLLQGWRIKTPDIRLTEVMPERNRFTPALIAE